MASCSRNPRVRASSATASKATFSSALTSMLQALSWPACSFPVYTVGLVALLASYSYIGTLRMSKLGAFNDGRESDWSMIGTTGVNVEDDNFSSCVIIQRGSNERSDERCVTTWSSWNASRTVIEDSMTSPFSPLKENATQFGTSRTEPESSCTKAKGSNAETNYQDQHQSQPMDGYNKPVRRVWPTGHYAVGRLMTVDNAITAIQWVALHVTVVSLFIAMRRLGSNFWLTVGVFMSSTYAFSFGLLITVKLGFPISARLLLEGVPFFVNVIGFPKHVVITKSVLSHNLESGFQGTTFEPSAAVSSTTQDAIRKAIGEAGSTVVRRYALEILVSAGGSLLTRNTTGGLHSFCVLAIWVLAFDCILLFTFFIAILMVKLEITRIKRQVDIGDNLEEDGISHDVAVSIARRTAPLSSSDVEDSVSRSPSPPPKLSHFTVFKAVMVTVFVAINVSNLYAIPLGNTHQWPPHTLSLGLRTANNSWTHALPSMVATLPGSILPGNRDSGESTVLTAAPTASKDSKSTGGSTYQNMDPTDSQTVVGLLESLEDPILSKWIAFALALSVVFNGYLFKAVTTPPTTRRPLNTSINRCSLVKAENFTSATSELESLPQTGLLTNKALHSAEHVQELDESDTSDDQDSSLGSTPARSPEDVEQMLKTAHTHELADEEVVTLALNGRLPSYALEKTLKDYTRAVKIRRSVISRSKATVDLTKGLEGSKLPYKQYNYADVFGACCENVIGYMPLPLGVAGPLVIDGQSYYIPMATTEGVLVASTSRGCKAINAGGGATTVLTGDGMTRGPCVRFETLKRAGEALKWLHSEAGKDVMKRAFDSTSRFARLESIRAVLAGPEVFIRFKTSTGDAMGMNMVSKGVEQSLKIMRTEGFDDMHIVSLSGNYCSDKKATAVNWIEGRGKSVVAEAIIPSEVVSSVLKTSVDTLVALNTSKNLVGSAMAGSLGGFNAHAANIVAAIYIATGQDPAQVVESASCITTMRNLGGSLQVCVSMPSVEVGTLGGGTILEPQSAMLAMLGVRGPHPTMPGEHARQLARIVAATTLAGELSLCGALSAGQLVQAHMQHNRSGKK